MSQTAVEAFLYAKTLSEQIRLTEKPYDPNSLEEYERINNCLIQLYPSFQSFNKEFEAAVSRGEGQQFLNEYNDVESFMYWRAMTLGLFNWQQEDPNEIARKAIEAMPQSVVDYKKGITKALGAMIGYCVKQGADPNDSRAALIKELGRL